MRGPYISVSERARGPAAVTAKDLPPRPSSPRRWLLQRFPQVIWWTVYGAGAGCGRAFARVPRPPRHCTITKALNRFDHRPLPRVPRELAPGLPDDPGLDRVHPRDTQAACYIYAQGTCVVSLRRHPVYWAGVRTHGRPAGRGARTPAGVIAPSAHHRPLSALATPFAHIKGEPQHMTTTVTPVDPTKTALLLMDFQPAMLAGIAEPEGLLARTRAAMIRSGL